MQTPWEVAQAWSDCDFLPYMIYDKCHIAMMGEPNGALWVAEPMADAFIC